VIRQETSPERVGPAAVRRRTFRHKGAGRARAQMKVRSVCIRRPRLMATFHNVLWSLATRSGLAPFAPGPRKIVAILPRQDAEVQQEGPTHYGK